MTQDRRPAAPERRRRGRPRQYDPALALDHAMGVFWAKGFAATSIDDLSTAMGMNPPSVYNAFGDKRALYRRALAAFVERLKAEARSVLFASDEISRDLLRFYENAIEVYCSSDPAPGCFVMCTAPVEAVVHADVREDLAGVISLLDAILAERFAAARDAGDVRADLDPRATARLAQAVLQSLALRARAGETKRALRKLARDGVALLLAG